MPDNIIVQVAGGAKQVKAAATVSELADLVGAAGYQATINGEPQDGSYELSSGEFVSFAKPVKAG